MKAFRLRGATGESPEALRLWELGCQGVREEASPDGVPELVAYFAEVVDTGLEGTWEDLPDVDYLAAYRAGLEPVDAGPLVVAPGHRVVELRDGETVVWLDPGSAFGTGHHETTWMALEALGRLELAGRTVLDVGAGSGVLAIAADALGAEAAFGIDVDPHAVAVARENARRNRSRARFAVGTLAVPAAAGPLVNPDASDGLGDAGTFEPARGLPGRCDVIVANLYAELHVSLMPAYASRLLPGGIALLTGVLTRLEEQVAAAAEGHGFALMDRRHAGEWSLLTLERVGP